MKLPSVDVRQQFIKFKGGLDEVTPPWEIPSGAVKRSQNVYQDVYGGYWTFQGYEAFDGRTAPSTATYSILYVTLTETVFPGDIITDGTEAAVVVGVESDFLVITAATGPFTPGTITRLDPATWYDFMTWVDSNIWNG